MERPEITPALKTALMKITGIHPGRRGTALCPKCKDALIHWEVSAYNGSIKAFCANASVACVSWDEGKPS